MDDSTLKPLAQALLDHAEKVRAQTEFLKIKQDELRPGDEVSFFGHLQAKEELTLEAGLLSGHLLMVQEQIQRSKRGPSVEVRHVLQRTVAVLNKVSF